MIKVPATFWNLLKKLGRKPEKMIWTTLGSRWAATDLTQDEIEMMRKSVEWCNENKLAPISGFVQEQKKGTYFIPTVETLPIMKIDCPPQKRVKVIEENSPFTLKLAYRNEE